MESLEGLEKRGGQVRLSANGGSLSLVFPEEVWDSALRSTSGPAEPTPDEVAAMEEIRGRLEDHATAHSFRTALRDVRCGVERSALAYDLVLEPSGLLAATTGYLFAPVVGRDLVKRVGECVGGGSTVEQAYVIGAVADEKALAAGDEGVKVLSVRGRRCSASRFEMPSELWLVLSRGLGWKDVETYTGGDSSCRS